MGGVKEKPDRTLKKAARRKRKRSASSESESSSDMDVLDTGGPSALWTYDLSLMCTKPEFDPAGIVKSLSAKEFTLDYVRNNGLKEPILFTDPPAHLGMKMPPASKFSVQSVKNLLGGDRVVEVIEVRTQSSGQMLLDEFVKYYKREESKRTPLLNVLSLEFSLTPLADKVLSPSLIREIDWVETFWPSQLRYVDTSTPDLTPLFPKVQHYCLMSVKDCFTDFHVDFGGTSVWYHVLKGRKIFWMIEPTEQNLVMYEKWILEGANNVFFGDIVEKCARIELHEGSTFIIPSGWIHAVYTPVDSLVFGGNFMHSFSIPMQLRVGLSESRIKVAKKYRYPFYNEMLWYVINGVVNKATGRSFLKPNAKHIQSTSSAIPPKEEMNSVDKVIESVICSGLQAESEEEPLLTASKESESVGVCEKHEETRTEVGEHKEQTAEEGGVVEKGAKSTEEQGVPEAIKEAGNSDVNEEERRETNEEKGEKCEEKGEVADVEAKQVVGVVNANGEGSAEKEFEADEPGKELTFDEAYLGTLSEAEREGYRELLLYMKKNMRFRTKMEPLNTITDPQRLIDVFEAVLNHEVNNDAVPAGTVETASADTVKTDEQTTEAKVEVSEVVVSPQPKPRERKRKSSTTATKKEKVPKTPKGKKGKADQGYHFDGPLIVGGLPRAIMPADAPQAPNPYGYDPLASVTALGHKQLPSAYRRTADMAKAPPTQKYRLQPLRQSSESHTEPSGGEGNLGPLRVDTSDVVASTSKSPLGSGGSTADSPKETGQNKPTRDGQRRVSDPSTSTAVHKDERNGANAAVSRHRAEDRPTTTGPQHKSSYPELEYKSPLARTYQSPVSPKIPKKDEERSQFPIRRPVSVDHSRRRYTDGSWHRPQFDGVPPVSSGERRLSQGMPPRGWHMAAPPPFWAPRPQQISPRGMWPPQEMYLGYQDPRQRPVDQRPRAPLLPSPPAPHRGNEVFIPAHSPPLMGNKGGTKWTSIGKQEVTPTGGHQGQSAVTQVTRTSDQQPSPTTSTTDDSVNTKSQNRDSNASEGHNERGDPHDGRPVPTRRHSHPVKKEEPQPEWGYMPTPICDLPPRPDELLGLPKIQCERDTSVTGILKRRHPVVTTTASPIQPDTTSPPPLPSTTQPDDTPQQPSSEHAPDPESPSEKTSPDTNGKRNRQLLTDAREQFPMAPPKLVEPKLAPTAAEETRKAVPLVDGLTAINELAKLMSEVSDEPEPAKPKHTSSTPVRTGESSTVVCDPRRVKREPVVAEETTEGAEVSVEEERQPVKEPKQEEPEDTSQLACFDDLSLLTAEYNALG